jgi:hypothetical protein
MIEKLCSFQMTYSDWLLLIADAEELLAQPEQENLTPRQGLEEYKKGYAKAELDLKREPLTDENVCEILLKKEWKGFVQLVRIIEKEHGIGVDDE